MNKNEKVKVKVVQPIKYNGKLYTAGKTLSVDKTVVDDAPWCFEVMETPEVSKEIKEPEDKKRK